MKKLFSLLAFIGIAATTSAQVTFTALNGTDGYNDEDIPCLFDGLSSKWCANASGAWFTFEASEPITLTGYAMRTGSDGETDNNNRNPKSWTIYGSNDNSSWTQIQQVTDNTDMDGKQQKTFYFTIEDNFTLYKYYKFTFQAVQSGNIIQISELIPSYTKYAEVSSLTGVDGGSAWTNDQAWTNMIDGNLSSKWSCWPWDDRDWFIVDAGAPIVLKRYMLSTGNDTNNNQGRNPKAWTIWGTNTENPTNGADIWTEVVNVTDQTMPITNGTAKFFDVVGTPAAYRYYKFKVTNVVEWGMFQLGEIRLNPVHDHSVSSTYSFAGGGTAQQVELCDVCNKAMTSGYKGFTLVDGKPFQVFVNGWGGNGSFFYSRSVSSSMGTICLPYSMNAGSKSDAAYYTLAYYNSESDVLVFDEVTGNLPDFTPALYITKNNATTINLDNLGGAAFSVTPTTNVTKQDRAEDGWEMVGTVKNGTASESGNSIYYLKGGDFYRCNGSISFKPYRAYITGPVGGSGVKAFGLADDMEDAINDIMPAENGEIQLFDLSGRKVSKVRNGEIYIMNGRKVMFNK